MKWLFPALAALLCFAIEYFAHKVCNYNFDFFQRLVIYFLLLIYIMVNWYLID